MRVFNCLLFLGCQVEAGNSSIYLFSGWSLTVAGDCNSPVGETSEEQLRRGEEAGTSKVLRVLEHQEVVKVADQDSTELQNSITCEGIKIFVVFSFQQKISRKIMNFRPNKTQGKQTAGN